MTRDRDMIRALRKKLHSLKPEHDTPIGLIHPYWARKPMNVLDAIIDILTTKGDTVLDPFMGSGTTLFSALQLGRTAIGSDINPLSHFLVTKLADILCNEEDFLPNVRSFIESFRKHVNPWYQINDNEDIIERERYEVEGTFESGRFKLIPTEIVLKTQKGRKNIKGSAVLSRIIYKQNFLQYKKAPIDFSKIHLTANSRIAIPKGAYLSHYFSERNQAAINVALTLIDELSPDSPTRDACELLLSSAIPLLRLSDKKASSQWPYWRPKKSLTSRNPIFVFEKRLKALEKLVLWTQSNSHKFYYGVSFKECRSLKHPFLLPVLSSIQDLHHHIGTKMKVDLIVTDPPYSDQAPYLAYSSMWNEILGFHLSRMSLRKEIVRYTTSDRLSDHTGYTSKLGNALAICSKFIKDDGIIVWFYQDHRLDHWLELSRTAKVSALSVVDIIPLPKQRRSMKTVTSPGTTLDGDLLCLFKKTKKIHSTPRKMRGNRLKQLEVKMKAHRAKTLVEKKALLLKYCFQYDLIEDIARNYPTIKTAIDGLTKGN